MKNGLLFFSLFCFSMQAFAQQPCRVEGNLHSTDPAVRAASQNYEATLQSWIQQHPNAAATTITIPVVVHVIWKTSIQNISDPQILSQIDVLNEDFGRTNTDAVNTPSGFQPVAANTGIQFCMAQADPNRNPTNGIDRIQTAATSFSTITDAQHSGTGGADAWDPSRYFNIWVCNLVMYDGSGETPTSTLSQTYGVVIRHNLFGRTGTVTPPLDRGRVCTHMVGHCLNLYHITEDASCIDNDFVTDTPVPSQSVSSCHAYPLLDACNPVAPGVMYMNYMMAGFFSDSCVNMFSTGQAARMNAVLNTPPYNTLAGSTACVPAGINTNSNLSDRITVSPNPSQGIFNVDLKGNSAAKILVYDILGNTIAAYFPGKINNGPLQIDLSAEAEGVYFLQIVTEENLLINKKIILSN